MADNTVEDSLLEVNVKIIDAEENDFNKMFELGATLDRKRGGLVQKREQTIAF